MDKRSLMAIVLITVIILLLPTYYNLIYDEPPARPAAESPLPLPVQEQPPEKEPAVAQTPATRAQPAFEVKEEAKVVSVADRVNQESQERIIDIETPLVHTRMSNRGGGRIQSWSLRKYDRWMGPEAMIIEPDLGNGVEINFLTIEGQKIDLNDLVFFSETDFQGSLILGETDERVFRYFIELNGIRVEKNLTIYGNAYHIDLEFRISDPAGLLLNNEYQIGWVNGLPPNEDNIAEDYTYSEAYASMADERESFSIESDDEVEEKSFIGKTDWIAVRTKYFLAAIMPENVQTTGVTFGGSGVKINEIIERRYNTRLNIPGSRAGSDAYRIYMGPLDHSVLTDYEQALDEIIMSHGWYEETFRAISLPIVSLLKFFYMFIPNYGIVIIIFSVLVKILVYPLTKKSYKSMKEMSNVQPLLTELREKYKSDPQRLNKETMKSYKEHGINPLGGCLPMLLQLPLLAALFTVFRSTIELRGASFIPGWINDLSRPDTLFHLGISIPFYGDQFNLLPILMAGSMIFQSKMTMQDPKQKAMVYLMPIFMLFLFNQFPSGLNLYYTLFNVLTILQQKFIDNKGPAVKTQK